MKEVVIWICILAIELILLIGIIYLANTFAKGVLANETIIQSCSISSSSDSPCIYYR